MAPEPADPGLAKFGVRFVRSGWLAALALLGTAVALMHPVASFDFLSWDDNRIIDALHEPGRWPGWLLRLDVTNFFTPVSLLVLRWLANGFGIEPAPFHVLGIALHVFNMLTLYGLMMRLQQRWWSGGSRWAWAGALAAAWLWGFNPLRVEVAAWMAALPYALSTALALLALHAYLPLTDEPRHRHLHAWGFALFYALAVMAHPAAAPLFVVPVLMDWIDRQNLRAGAWWYIACLLLAVVTMAGQAYVRTVLGAGGLTTPGLQSITTEVAKALGFLGDFALLHAWWPMTVSLVYAGYDSTSWMSAPLLLATVLFLGVGAVCLRLRGDARKWLLAWVICHLAFTLPAAGIGASYYLLADRYLYLPTVFTAICCGLLVTAALTRLAMGRHIATRVAVICSLGFVALYYASLFSGLLQSWRNTESLMDRLVQSAPDRSWELWAKLRKLDHQRSQPVSEASVRATLLSMAQVRSGDRRDLATAVGFLVRRGRCAEAEQLHFIASDPTRGDDSARSLGYLRFCRRASH